MAGLSWQFHQPRQGVLAEALTLNDVLRNTLRFDYDYLNMFAMNFTDQTWFSWEYNAFAGPGPWLVVIAAAWLWARQRRLGNAPSPIAILPWAGLLCVVVGCNLAMGNENPWSVAHLFAYLPLLSGVRGFGRYQVLVIFGLALGVSVAAPYLLARLPERARRAGAILLAAGICLPGVVQTAVLLSAIPSSSNSELEAIYHLSERPRATPAFAGQKDVFKRGRSDQSFLLSKGYWVSTCYEPLHVARPHAPGEPLVFELSEPPPQAVDDLAEVASSSPMLLRQAR